MIWERSSANRARIAKSIRAVVKAAAAKENKRVIVDITQ